LLLDFLGFYLIVYIAQSAVLERFMRRTDRRTESALTFGKVLRTARMQANKTQRNLAMHLNKHNEGAYPALIGSIEYGCPSAYKRLSLKDIHKLEDYLDLKPNHLLSAWLASTGYMQLNIKNTLQGKVATALYHAWPKLTSKKVKALLEILEEGPTYIPKDDDDPVRYYGDGEITHTQPTNLHEPSVSVPGWYFWCKHWINLHGPYETLGACLKALREDNHTQRILTHKKESNRDD
jgi:hypothetical protein